MGVCHIAFINNTSTQYINENPIKYEGSYEGEFIKQK